jgi:hypothetical protein
VALAPRSLTYDHYRTLTKTSSSESRSIFKFWGVIFVVTGFFAIKTKFKFDYNSESKASLIKPSELNTDEA